MYIFWYGGTYTHLSVVATAVQWNRRFVSCSEYIYLLSLSLSLFRYQQQQKQQLQFNRESESSTYLLETIKLNCQTRVDNVVGHNSARLEHSRMRHGGRNGEEISNFARSLRIEELAWERLTPPRAYKSEVCIPYELWTRRQGRRIFELCKTWFSMHPTFDDMCSCICYLGASIKSTPPSF